MAMIAHMQLQLTIDTPATNETVPTKTLTSVKKKKKTISRNNPCHNNFFF